MYSNGAEVPPSGMDDQSVLQFWLHGERCSGIGLKCQLCGLRSACKTPAIAVASIYHPEQAPDVALVAAYTAAAAINPSVV